MELHNLLTKEAKNLGIELDDAAVTRLFRYMDFLTEYNRKVNLTSITEPREIVVKHFLDSLSVAGAHNMAAAKVIDIGSGAGFPGMVIKIACPGADVTLMDSTGKKVRFLEQAAQMLNLEGITCIHARAEEHVRRHPAYAAAFDFAVARAVAPLDKLLKFCMPYVAKNGVFIAMKGRNYHEELKAAPLKGKTADIREVNLPDGIVHSLISIANAKRLN